MSVAKSRMSMVASSHLPSAERLAGEAKSQGSREHLGEDGEDGGAPGHAGTALASRRPTLLLEQPGLDFADALHLDSPARLEHEARRQASSVTAPDTWISPGSPCNSSREARFTVSPQTS